MFGNINMWVGAAAGAALVGIVGWGYNALVDNPSVVRETTQRVQLESRVKTLTAINEVTDAAQKARAMRRFCRDDGRVYDFTTGQCRETGPNTSN